MSSLVDYEDSESDDDSSSSRQEPPSATVRSPPLCKDPIRTLKPSVPISTLDPGVSTRTLDPGVSIRTLDPGVSSRTLYPGVPIRTLDAGVSIRTLDAGVSIRPLDPGVPIRTLDAGVSTPHQTLSGLHGVNMERSKPMSWRDFQPKRRVDVDGTCGAGGVKEEDCGGRAAGGLPSTEGNPLRLWTPQGSDLVQRSVSPAVRPYIPKRQRVAASSEAELPQHGESQSRGSPLLWEASPTLEPYLNGASGAAEVPRRLLMTLGGHDGPVNTVQWCPVARVSHLLLSASMDHTFKVWDGAGSGRCLRAYSCHSGAVRDACWTPCGRRLLTGSFDNTAALSDAETGQPVIKLDNRFKVTCVALHPTSPEVFLCGGYSSAVNAWDSRSAKMVKVYKAAIQQTLDILFLRGGGHFITSSDCVSMDSADRTLIAWDFQTTAKLSNQIYHERYTCPSLAVHPLDDAFVAQSNGSYVAVFSSRQPFRMNKRRRFEGHKVEGYAVRCGFSQDGTLLASGSSSGSAHFYDFHTARPLHTLRAHSQPCLCVCLHPVLPATAATCDWAGGVKVWH